MTWLEKDGYPLWPFWSHVQSWWDLRLHSNVLLVHFNALKADMEGEIRRIARFLGLEPDPGVWPRILEHCTFEYMKRNARTLSPRLSIIFSGGAATFLNRGTIGRWRDVLRADDVRQYEEAARRNLTPDCARWLETGQ